MQIEDMTDRQITIRINKIAREIYNLGLCGANHTGVVVDINTLDFHTNDLHGSRLMAESNDEIAVLSAFMCYAGTSLDDAKEEVRERLEL